MKARVEELFHAVADLSPEARTRYFAEHEVDDEARREVEALLAFDCGASEFLRRDITVAASLALPQLEPKSGRCGPYRLLQMVGRGGMGAVYLAERADGEVTQRVAIKMLPPGAGDANRERFLKERQIFASLAHPHIARMLDAGHLDSGQPFLAMEYVDGKPIDIYAGALAVRQKISLFLKVCAAVSYLHRNLVVHRDLKPSNILVTTEGEPKLLDFGIAKILDVTTDATATGMRMLTPDYASPEQVVGGPMSTATDIYSLGAVLYRLLTGKPAHEFEANTPEVIAQVVTKGQITRPSKWQRELKGDLEFILLKALRKDPQERYGTVEQFAEDLEAFLESRPVRARSGNTWYHVRKFMRRYWMPVVAAALVIASLSAGLYEANRQRVIAERRFQQLRQLSNKIFDLDKAIKNLPGSIQARQSLVSASLEYLQGLASYAHEDLDLAREVGEGYWRVGRIQGVPVELNLGDEAKAEETLKKADELIDSVLMFRPTDRTAMFRSAVIAHDRMILAQEAHRNADAVAFAHKFTDRIEIFLRRGDVQDSERNEAAGMYVNLSLVSGNMHMYENAIAYARRTVELARPIPSAKRNLSAGLRVLATTLQNEGDLDGALQAVIEARKIADETVYADATVRMTGMCGVLSAEGRVLGEDGGVNLNQPEQAIEAFQGCVDLAEALAQKDPNDALSRIRVANVGGQLANVLRHSDPKRALAVYDLVIRRLGEVRNDVRSRRDQAVTLANSSYALRRLYRATEAKQRIHAALDILKETKDYPTEQVKLDSEIFTVTCALADYEADGGDPHRALEIYEQLLDKVIAGKPEPLTDLRDAPKMSRLYEALTFLYRRTGDTAKMQIMVAQRLELWRQWDGKLPNNAFVRRQLEAVSLAPSLSMGLRPSLAPGRVAELHSEPAQVATLHWYNANFFQRTPSCGEWGADQKLLAK